MNFKKSLYFFACIFILSFLVSCSSKANYDMLVISSPDNNTINYYEYNTVTKKQKKIHTVTKTCYPTASLSKDNSILYYTKCDTEGYPQLFSRDISKNTETQLTSVEDDNIVNVDFLKINYDNNLVYLRVIQDDHINFNLAIYDIKSDKVKILNKNELDVSNQFFDYANDPQSILAIENSEEEKYNVMEKANDTQDMSLAAESKLILKDENGKNLNVYDSIKCDITDVSLSPDNTSALILTAQAGVSDNQDLLKNVLLKDFDNNDGAYSILDNTSSYKNISQVSFSSDGKGFFFIASESDLHNSENNLYYYDLDSNDVNKQLTIKNESIFYITVINK